MTDNFSSSTQAQNTTGINETLEQDTFGFLDDKTSLLLGGYLSFVGVTGLSGSILIIVAYVTKKSIRSRRNLLYLNLAVSDIVLTAIMIPLSATAFFLNSWPFGYIGCQIYGFLGFVSCTSTMVTHSYIAYERYSVLATTTNLTQIDYKNTACKIAMIWAYSILWASLPLMGWSHYEYEPYKLSCTIDWYEPSMLSTSFIVAAVTFTFFLPLVFCAVYYTKIIKKVLGNEPNIINYRCMEFGRSKRVAMMTLILLLSFILAWGPYVVLAVMGSFGFFRWFSPQTSVVAPILAKSSVFISPIATYVLVEKQFRLAVIELLCQVRVNPTAAVSPAPTALRPVRSNRSMSWPN